MTVTLNAVDVGIDVLLSALLTYFAFSANCTLLVLLAIISAMMTAFIPHPMIQLLGALTTSLIIARIVKNNGQICRECCSDYIKNTVCKSCCPGYDPLGIAPLECYQTMTSLCGKNCFKPLAVEVIGYPVAVR